LSESARAAESDLSLVRNVLTGSQPHFDLLFQTYFDRVYAAARHRLDDVREAERVTEEVFAVLLRDLAIFDGRMSLAQWVLGILKKELGARR